MKTNNNQKIYRYITIFIEIISFSFLLYFIYLIITNLEEYRIKEIFSNNIGFLLVAIVLFLLCHALRMFRIYVLLMENRIKTKEIFKVYTKSTLINNILPYKTGELYKIVSYGNMLKDYIKGFLLIWIDRFFDTVVILLFSLVLILQGYNIKIFYVLIFVVLASILIYFSFPGTYKYFNSLLLSKSKSKKGVIYLKILDESNKLYVYTKELIKGRSIILIALSATIWVIEYLFITMIYKILYIPFENSLFMEYINQSFFFNENYSINSSIKILSVIFLLLLTVVAVLLKGKGSKNEK